MLHGQLQVLTLTSAEREGNRHHLQNRKLSPALMHVYNVIYELYMNDNIQQVNTTKSIYVQCSENRI